MCQHWHVDARQFARLLGAAVVTAWAALLSPPILTAPASAAPCPDVEVTFARGTEECSDSYGILDHTALGRQEDWEEPKGRADQPHDATPDFSS